MATTLAQIFLDAKDLADMLNNPIVADPTWRRWVNQGVESLYRLLVVKAPARFHKSVSFTLTGLGGNTTAIAADFRTLRESGVTKDPTVPSQRRTLRQFNFGERDFQGQLVSWGTGRELAFDIQAGNIVVEPASLCAGNYAYYYLAGPVPFATDGSGDAVTIATVFEPYVDYVAHYAAIRGLAKEESSTQEQRLNLAAMVEEIQSEFNDNSDPSTIVDMDATGGGIWP